MEVLSLLDLCSKTQDYIFTVLGLGLYTQALTRGRVHTYDTKWKESAFYANTSLIAKLHNQCQVLCCTKLSRVHRLVLLCLDMII
mgnify:CR=1 FL=1